MELITMSKEELKRKGIMDQLVEKRIRQKAAAEILGISVRQLKRLLGAYRLGRSRILVD
jgi:DNA-binding NtrC family response regulator